MKLLFIMMLKVISLKNIYSMILIYSHILYLVIEKLFGLIMIEI